MGNKWKVNQFIWKNFFRIELPKNTKLIKENDNNIAVTEFI